MFHQVYIPRYGRNVGHGSIRSIEGFWGCWKGLAWKPQLIPHPNTGHIDQGRIPQTHHGGGLRVLQGRDRGRGHVRSCGAVEEDDEAEANSRHQGVITRAQQLAVTQARLAEINRGTWPSWGPIVARERRKPKDLGCAEVPGAWASNSVCVQGREVGVCVTRLPRESAIARSAST